MTQHGVQSIKDGHPWWADLRHGGLLLSPVVLAEWHSEGPPPAGRVEDARPGYRVRRLAGRGQSR